MPTLIVVAGPTAVGKTDLCVRLAQKLNTEILSADSRQFYNELNIGTAKPTASDMAGVRHHFVGSHSVSKLYSAGSFERDALATLDQIFSTNQYAIVAGGSGLYIKALCEGLDDLPTTPPQLRTELMNSLKANGLAPLQAQLQTLDPVYCQTNDLQNSQRVVRALEVCLLTGRPFSSFKVRQVAQRPFEIISIAINRDRDDLYSRIDNRADKMLTDGLVDEVKNLALFRNHNALQTVGYKEVFDYLDGKYNYLEMVRLIKRNTRHYAKRQLTWFKHQGSFEWFSADDFDGIMARVKR